MQFNNEELKNLAVLLQRVDLKGNEAMAVAVLQQKIAKLITPEVEVKSTESVEKSAEGNK